MNSQFRLILANSLKNEPRVDVIPVFSYYLLFLCFALISISLLLNRRGIYLLIIENFRPVQNNFSRESVKYGGAPGILLIISYIITAVGFVDLSIHLLMKSYFNLISLFPVAWIVWTSVSALIVSFISGEFKQNEDGFKIWLMDHQLNGIILWLFFLALSIYPNLSEPIIIASLSYIILAVLWRYFRILINLYVKGIAWYYLILYFCTLEIIPLVVLTIVITENIGMI